MNCCPETERQGIALKEMTPFVELVIIMNSFIEALLEDNLK